RQSAIPVLVINGRLSPKSARHWKRFGNLAKPVFQLVSHFGVQTNEYSENLNSLGVEASRITVTGSVKFDGVEVDRNNAPTRAMRELFGIRENAVVWVAGSTQAPEESGVIEIYRQLRAVEPRLRLIIVPRQKERFDDVAQLIESASFQLV